MSQTELLLNALKPFADAYCSWSGSNAREHFSSSVAPEDFLRAADAYRVNIGQGRLIAAAPQLYRVAKVIEAAYLNGPANDFHTRLNALAGGNFAHLLIDALEAVELAA